MGGRTLERHCRLWDMSVALSGSSGGRGSGERGMGGAVLGLIREGRGHGELDAAHAGAHQGADFQTA